MPPVVWVSGSRKWLVSTTSDSKWKQTTLSPLRSFQGVFKHRCHKDNLITFCFPQRSNWQQHRTKVFLPNVIQTCQYGKMLALTFFSADRDRMCVGVCLPLFFLSHTHSCWVQGICCRWNINPIPWKHNLSRSADTNTGCHWRDDYFSSFSPWVILSFPLRARQSVNPPPPPPPTLQTSPPRHWASLMLTCHIWKLFHTCAA